MILRITKNSDPIWKKKFSDIQITPALPKIVADMQETLSFTMGVGLAAPQVGYPWRMFIVDFADLQETFINPKIIKKNTETDFVEEGCLSIPGYRGFVERSTELEIEYTNLTGERKLAKLSGFYARIIQHEYDHLNSLFYINHIKKPKHLLHFDPIKIVFFGSSDFSATILKSLIGQSVVGDYNVDLVITSPDRPTGRGQIVQANPVKQLANEFGIEVLAPEKIAKKEGSVFQLTNQEVFEKIKAVQPDQLVLASYGKIIPQEILALPKYYPINVHPSLLPKYRGAAPIQAALLRGDKNTGVTIMAMNEKMDEGDIFVRAKFPIKPTDTYQSLSAELAKLGTELAHHVIHETVLGKLKPKPQKHEKATYTKLIKKEDGKIDWRRPPKKLDNLIRAYYPWPGVWTDYNGRLLKLLPGKKVQLEGRNPTSLKDFKSGHKDFNLDW